MPASKNTLSRYQVINTCFLTKTKKYWSQEELLRKLEENDLIICSRTLRADMEAMRFDDKLGYHAPIEYCSLHKGYYYTNPEYSINQISLNNEEVYTLLAAIDMIKPYSNISVFRDFQSIVTKVVHQTNGKMLPGKPFVPEIENVCHLPQATNDLINYFLEAIRKKEVIKILLDDTGLCQEDRELLFHPYTLSTDHEHWYIIGLRDSDHIHTFLQLDWITNVVSTDRPYIPYIYEGPINLSKSESIHKTDQ
jgi:predicted DNA-binding transcriptional regulator YafY